MLWLSQPYSRRVRVIFCKKKNPESNMKNEFVSHAGVCVRAHNRTGREGQYGRGDAHPPVVVRKFFPADAQIYSHTYAGKQSNRF